MGVYGNWLTFGARLKWPLEELQFLALPHWLNFSAPDVAACAKHKVRLMWMPLVLQVWYPKLSSSHRYRYFTQNHNCQPHCGARGKVRGSRKPVGFILWEPECLHKSQWHISHMVVRIRLDQRDEPTDRQSRAASMAKKLDWHFVSGSRRGKKKKSAIVLAI